MLDKYNKIKNIKTMKMFVDNYNYYQTFDKENVDSVISNFLRSTMLFISVYGLESIRSNILYYVNFIVDNCITNENNLIVEQLKELIIALDAYPLIYKLPQNENNNSNYIDFLKVNIRKIGNYYYTDKQINIYGKIFEKDKDIIFSAPTSYGKTHLSLISIFDMINHSLIKNVLIIVPTKALINEYRKDINELNIKNDINIFESPYVTPDFNKINIFIYTQERALVAVDYAGISKKVDLILIDEAQCLAEILNDRTLLLVKLLNYFKDIPKIYLAPFVQNIYNNVIKNVVNSSLNKFVMELTSDDTIVSNNKYVVDISQIGKIIWYNATFANNENELIKIREYKSNKLYMYDDNSYSLAIDIILDKYGEFVKKDEKSIIYIASKQESMNIALKIYNNLYDKKIAPSSRVKALIKHIQENIHEKFILLKFLQRGVAYHNSYLDSYTKRQLEYILSSNDKYLDKLVCTNTIESGVNLGAKNIFVLIKSKMQGKNTEIKYANLLGRAARLSCNTQGNLFYIKMNSNCGKYEKEFYKSSEQKKINISRVTINDINNERNIAYQSFLEDEDIINNQKEKFLSDNKFYKENNYLTNGTQKINFRKSNGLDYYIDYNTILKSENVIKSLDEETIKKYLNCLGNYNDTKEFIEFLSRCYDWEHSCVYSIRNRMKDSALISMMITFLVQGRSIKDIVNNRIKKMDDGEYEIYVNPKKNYVKVLRDEYNTDEDYELFNKNNLEHINILIINSLDQTQNLIEFHVKKYIQDFYFRIRKIHGQNYINDNMGNFLEFSAIDDKKIILIENGIIDSFALTEFIKSEYSEFFDGNKVKLDQLLNYVRNKFSDESPFYYAVKDIM